MCLYNINDPRLACQFVRTSQETNQTITPRVHPKEVTDPWSEGAIEEYKIWHDGWADEDKAANGFGWRGHMMDGPLPIVDR